MNRNLWKETLTAHSCPAWPCPSCRKGSLQIVPKSLVEKETLESKRCRSDDDWDPEWITYSFTAWLECNHCKKEVAVSGTGGVEPGYGEDGMSWGDYFAARILWPMPDIFRIPPKCPEEVSDKLREGFQLFWLDAAAAATRVRVALERLMDHLGVKKIGEDGKEMTLHKRIEEFAKNDVVTGNQLMALKWLGNTGGHEGTVKLDDLLDAFEIMEHALAEVIDKRSAKVAELAKRLIERHGR